MSRGGARPGAGRKPGSANIKTREIADKAASEGLTPLEYMLTVLRDETQEQAVRFEAAFKAAPYVHARLSAIEAKVDVAVTDVAADPEESEAEWMARHAG